MKHIKLIFAFATIFSSLFCNAQSTDSEDHRLVSLWKSYYSAEKADKPNDELSALEKIKAEALSKHFIWDYYDAADKFREVKIRQNWNLYEEQRDKFRKDIEKTESPIAVFYYKKNEESATALRKHAEDNRNGLLSSHNPEFYKRDYTLGSECGLEELAALIKNDWDYTLWHLYFRDKSKREQLLAAYPAELQLLARAEALQTRMETLNRENAGQEQYLKLDEDCHRFISDAQKLDEPQRSFALSIYTPQNLIEQMEFKSIRSSITDSKLAVVVRNLHEVNAVIKDARGKTVFRTTLRNSKDSFYLPDTLTYILPALEDGNYKLECSSGKVGNEANYQKFTLSIASRFNDNEYSIFVADYMSGEPLETCSLQLQDSDGKILSGPFSIKLEDGFTTIPKAMNDVLLNRVSSDKTRWENYIVASNGGKKTRPLHISEYPGFGYDERKDQQNAILLTDRKAYNQGETIHFKAVLYQGVYEHRLNAQGKEVTVKFTDPKRREIDSKTLKTNEFGSIAGEFTIPADGLGGNYTLTVETGGRRITSQSVRADHFVLPTFTLKIDKDNFQYEKPVESVSVSGKLTSYTGHSLSSAKKTYEVSKYGETLESGDLQVSADGSFAIEIKAEKEDTYQYFQLRITITGAAGETREFNNGISLAIREKPKEPTEYFFKEIKGEGIALRAMAGSRTIWMLAELYGNGNILLEKRLLKVEPDNGTADVTISYPYKSNYPELITLHVLYFQNGKEYSHSHDAQRKIPEYILPLKFTRFLDTTAPAKAYEFTIKTAPGVECAATIFDVSTESINPNRWSRIRVNERPVDHVAYMRSCGLDKTNEIHPVLYGAMAKSAGAVRTVAQNSAVMMESFAVAEEAFDEEAPEIIGAIREDFANTVAWEPFLRSDKDGLISFGFNNSDKLSTYYVQLFAHDKEFHNSVLRKEMMVTLPVKLAIVEPAFLYSEDRYTARITLSNNLSEDVRGKVGIRFLDGKDYKTAATITQKGQEITIPANGSTEYRLEIQSPGNLPELGILVNFNPEREDYGSDAVFVSVPVMPSVQTITEAHSAVLRSGEDRNALIERLRSEFIGIDGKNGGIKEISILQMLLEAIPDKLERESDNAISLAETYYANALLEKLGVGRLSAESKDEILRKLSECHCADGGYAWFKGMESSPIVTATILQLACESGMPVRDDAMKYLDDEYFRARRKFFWLGRLSLEQYAYTRALYGDIPFLTKGMDAKALKAFRKELDKYLLPAGRRGLDGQILAKLRRVRTLQALQSSPALAEAWRVKLGRKAEKSIRTDVESILQYTQPHRSGGWYYPNAVMPWRGLMESELHAHVLLCRLLDNPGPLSEQDSARAKEISDGIRLWFMIQKETRNWKSNPAYLEALGEALKGSEDLLQTKVIALEASYTKPFGEIAATGNGFTVERRFLRGSTELKEGDVLHVGERVRAEYLISNEENRSFVLLKTPHHACLRPVNELSSCYSSYYKNVLPDGTQFWYESYPEGKTTISEDFFVTQEGTFHSPAVTVESLYAPHYRANASAAPIFTCKD